MDTWRSPTNEISFPTTLNGQGEQMWLLSVTTEEDNYMHEKLIDET